MNWGKWIIASFILFAVFIATLVYISVSQDINLVTKNYYEEELAYQDQIDRMQNTKSLEVLPTIVIENGILQLQYDDLPRISAGKIDLFRPSDAQLDQKFELARTEDTSVQFQLTSLKKGLYKARFSWEMNGKGYYYEKIIVL